MTFLYSYDADRMERVRENGENVFLSLLISSDCSIEIWTIRISTYEVT